jgi:hypothetical protein
MGANLTDLATRNPAARAGFAQGKKEVARLEGISLAGRSRP